MTIYNLNFGIGWASSGVEYAQKYRAELFRKKNIKFKNIFLDFFSLENIQTLTEHMNYLDEEIIWLYQYFTDIKIAPTTYTFEDYLNTLKNEIVRIESGNKNKIIHLKGEGNYIRCFLKNNDSTNLDRVEYILDGKIIKKDVFTYTKLYSEYYAPVANKAKLYMREFFNEDGTIAYTEYLQEEKIYHFKDKILYGKNELVSYLFEKLNLTEEDILLIDRSTGLGAEVLKNVKSAKAGVVIHAEHFSESLTTEQNILWNNHYEFVFNNHQLVDFFIVSTDTQNEVLSQQFKKYYNAIPKIYTVPVGSLKELTINNGKPFSIMTASRLAKEKHIDWLIDSVVKAKESIHELTFDIYGEGGEREVLREKINKNNAQSYIILKGHADLRHVYKKYQLFLSGSTSEGFGLTLMEAVGSGLGMIGFNVNYGNPTFIKNGKNGYIIDIDFSTNYFDQITNSISEAIIKFFNDNSRELQNYSHNIAEDFLEEKTLNKWETIIKEVSND